MGRGAGRPKKEVKRDIGIRIRMTQEEYDMMKSMAEECNLSMSELVRTVIRTHHDVHSFAQKHTFVLTPH